MVLRSLQLLLVLGLLVLPLVVYLLLFLFHFYCNFGSECVTRWGIEYFNLNNWAGYVDKINKQNQSWLLWLLIEYLPNRLTPLYSKIYYKEENYLKVRTAVFKYINSSIIKFGTSVRRYIWYVSMWVYEYVRYVYNYVTRLPLVL